ncbi:hypothetical protein IQ249_15245 [Lusitaniella coriacea LEGE 07157]|uniref:Uncharacterized protein n=1 Tax=Lusitaniella coriacea LEGE 07157 TaxID=945747 RepID=A0A8J7JC79_9CYAN|nr:hypothetical protein [Lusitaniella coriacea]MBE9117255.1 hypothetical protein [Lusitaniella coriacea LEGE 07157]
MSPSPKKLTDSILKSQNQTSEQMLRWLEAKPEFAHLREIAASEGELKQPQPPQWQRALKSLKTLVWTEGSTLYGRSDVNPNLIQEAKTTATTLSAANLLNTLTAYPYLYYAFAGLGGLGAVLTLLMGVLLTKTGNTLGETACRNSHRGEALTGLVGVVLLNLVLTLTSGPGIELLLDPPGLAERRGQELIREKVLDTHLQEQNLAQRQERANLAQADCQAILQDLKALPADSLNRDLLYQQAYGTWGERNRDWSQVALINLPLCRKAARIEQEAQLYAEQIQSEREAKQAEIQRYGSSLLYLKAVRPDIYRTHFDEDGQLRSGLEASRLSLQGFAQKLSAGDVSQLGFPLFFFTVSLVTSGIAIAKLAFYAQRQDVRRSWDLELYQLREELFYQVLNGLHPPDEPVEQEQSASHNGRVPH